jgi:hypothetical protein
MTNSQRKSVVSLIFKDGDRDNLCFYRPISLTNTDYKIMAFVLANRLQNVLPSIISYDQTGYIKNRSINTNIRLVDDILNFSQSKKLQTAVLFLDFSKAFDSLEWNFMFQVLEKFNFGPSFIKWIKILYNEPELYIKNNGYMSRRILMDRGIRQGCPLSALLFIIAVEIFSVLCRTGTEYKGVTIDLNNKCNTIFITQYADDMCLFVENIGEVDNAIKAVDKFGLISGLCLNKAKTKILNTGEQLVETNFFDIQISSGAEKCLGIYVGTDKIKCEQKNWYDKVTKIEHTLTTWAKRDLTYFGRITIIKTLILPIINFVGYNTIIPDWVFIKLERLFFKFLWSGHDKMKRSSVIGDLKYGGLNMVDIKSFLYSQKYKWLNCILENGGNCNWSFIPFTYFESLGIDKFIYGVNSEVFFESLFF